MNNTLTTTSIDFIGDIHGEAEELTRLLEQKLGYDKTNGYYKHPTRKAFFVGDFIDRGPAIKGVLEIVKPMIDHGSAHAVIGNHEYNAICYWTRDDNGNPLRKHSIDNTKQHIRTIDSFADDDLLLEYIEWFKTLPIYFENERFRVVHAQWKDEFIHALRKWDVNNFNDAEFLLASSQKNNDEYRVVEGLLKGEEVHLPGIKFKDAGLKVREQYRIKWWLGGNDLTYRNSLFEFPEDAEDGGRAGTFYGYGKNDVPVFFGHYWLKDRSPAIQQSNVCCLDFSVAKGGILAAYRWDGEQTLSDDKFKFV